MVSSNLVTTGVNLTFGTSCAFALLAVGEALAALLSDHWFDYSSASSNSLDLWQSCYGSNCTDYVFTDVNRELCTLNGAELQGRIFTLRGLMIAAPVLMVAYCLFVLLGLCCDSLGAIAAGVVSSVVSCFCIIAEIGLFYQTCESYFFCGMSACDYYAKLGGKEECYTMYGGPFGLVWTAGTASLLTTVLGAAAMYRMRSAPNRIPKLRGRDGKTSTVRRGAGGSRPNKTLPGTEMGRRGAGMVPAAVASGGSSARRRIQAPLEGWRMDADDFEYDMESGYYFSSSANLYFDEESKMFFDPEQQDAGRPAWFDAQEMRWG